MSLLRLEDVGVSVSGHPILDLPALGVEEGEIHVVLGPTGAGKSTLLRVMNLLQRPDRGAIFWRGERIPWPAPLALRRRMAMVFQSPLLFSGSVLDNVAYGLKIRGERGARARAKAEAMLRRIHIDHAARQRASTLSGGEAQRAAIARAMVLDPDLLLLDEPLSALDEPIREHLLEELRQIVRERRITCVYVTHEQSEAFALADRISILGVGKLLQTGAPEEVFYRPSGRAVAEFLKTGNILSGEIVARDGNLARVRIGGRTFWASSDLPPASRVLACIRPEEIHLTRNGDAGANRLDGTVTALLNGGPTIKIEIDCGFPVSALVTRRTVRELDLRRGERVGLAFEPVTVHLIPDEETQSMAADPSTGRLPP
ncbi:MAG: ABC transporter ATP-binding protein [Acidobacteriia bacterium]|nr:ABC transporter ATP-binding protein [Terriglobia bacterium]